MTTLIGYGSPNKAGTHDVHGAALGASETEETRNNLGWKYPPFELPDGVADTMSRVEDVRPHNRNFPPLCFYCLYLPGCRLLLIRASFSNLATPVRTTATSYRRAAGPDWSARLSPS